MLLKGKDETDNTCSCPVFTNSGEIVTGHNGRSQRPLLSEDFSDMFQQDRFLLSPAFQQKIPHQIFTQSLYRR